MHTIQWSDTYLIGLPDLDAEHRRMVAMINAVIAAAADGNPPKTVLGLIDDFMALMLPHMKTEQEMMEPLAMPQGIAHRRRHLAGHAEFIRRINALRADIADGRECNSDLDGLGVFLTVPELINSDYEMVGELRRERLLHNG
jgi:hemerythrin